jgi:CBS domain-containing protein
MRTRSAVTRVNDIMSRAPTSVRTSTTFEELLELFDRHDFNAFPVTSAVNELVGIVTKVDLLRVLRLGDEHELPEQTKALERSVGDIMRAGVISVDGEDPIGVAADLMVETGLRSVPVVLSSGGRRELVGMVSRGDVIRGFRLAM